MNWSHVQGATAQANGVVENIAATFAGSVAVGDLLVVSVATYSGSMGTVTDSAGNSYTLVDSTVNSFIGRHLCHATATTGGSGIVVTATPASSCYLATGTCEFSPPSGTAQIVVDSSNSATGSGTSQDCGSLSVTGTNMAYCTLLPQGAFSPGTVTQGSLYSLDFSVVQGGGTPAAVDVEWNTTDAAGNPQTGYGEGQVLATVSAAVSTGPVPGASSTILVSQTQVADPSDSELIARVRLVVESPNLS